MAGTVLAFYLVFAVVGFGWRSWLHYRRTGSTGLLGVRGKPGTAAWFAEMSFVVAVVCAVAAPVAQLFGSVAPISLLDNGIVRVAGVLLALAGLVVTVVAQLGLGESWRVGVDPAATTELVRTGVFGVVRNPIYTGMLIFFAGTTAMAPNPLALLGFALVAAGIEGHVRVVEEPYLRRVHGERYRDYTAEVGRFVPLLGRTAR